MCENDILMILVIGTSMMHNHCTSLLSAYNTPLSYEYLEFGSPIYETTPDPHSQCLFSTLHSNVEISTRRTIRPYIDETS